MNRLLALLLCGLLPLTSTAAVFSVEPRFAPEHPRNLYFPPLISLVLPGFDQYWERQYAAGAVYTTVGVSGLTLAASVSGRISRYRVDRGQLDKYRDLERQYSYGLQLYMFSGELSLFHSFRTAVESRPEEFAFIKVRETTADLALAPFEFGFLARPTTFLPLLAIAGWGIADLKGHAGHLDLGDAAFTGGTSYNAGVGEEALFRGYLMPMLRAKVANDFWSNSLIAITFGAAHLNSHRNPWPQALAGWYLGWLTQRNDWSLRQAIFVHAWWDVIAIGLSISRANSNSDRVIPLPGLEFTF